MYDRVALLPEWAVTELRRPVHCSDALREKVMAGVRAAGQPSGVTPAVIRTRTVPVRPARGFRVSGALLALAASVAWLAASATLVRSRGEPTRVIRDATPGRMIVLGDTVDSALHDTLRLVRFVLDAPSAARVAIAGDFNGWSRRATPLTDSSGSGVWSVVVALDRGSRRYSFVVNDTQWVSAVGADSGAEATPIRSATVGGDST